MLTILYVLTMAFDRLVLYGNVVFSVVVLSTRMWYSTFLKKAFVSHKTCFKVKVMKTLKISSDFHKKKHVAILNGGQF